MSSWETDEMHAAAFAIDARKHGRRIAWLVQEAIGCEGEIDKMPVIAKEVQELLNNLERAVSLLGPHRRKWLKVVNSEGHKKVRAAFAKPAAAEANATR